MDFPRSRKSPVSRRGSHFRSAEHSAKRGRFVRAPIAGLTLGLMLMTSGIVAATPLSLPIVNPTNGHTYILLNTATWTASEAEAVSLGGHLATIRNRGEQDWVFQTFGRYDGRARLLWIDFNDKAIEGRFVWTSGEAVSFTFWA